MPYFLQRDRTEKNSAKRTSLEHSLPLACKEILNSLEAGTIAIQSASAWRALNEPNIQTEESTTGASCHTTAEDRLVSVCGAIFRPKHG